MNKIFTVIVCAFLLISLSSCTDKEKKEQPSSIASPGIVESNVISSEDEDSTPSDKEDRNSSESSSNN